MQNCEQGNWNYTRDDFGGFLTSKFVRPMWERKEYQF